MSLCHPSVRVSEGVGDTVRLAWPVVTAVGGAGLDVTDPSVGGCRVGGCSVEVEVGPGPPQPVARKITKASSGAANLIAKYYGIVVITLHHRPDSTPEGVKSRPRLSFP
jgi:hypothetical protein